MIVALVGMTLIMAVARGLAHSARSAGRALLATLAGIVGATVAWMLMSRFMVMDERLYLGRHGTRCGQDRQGRGIDVGLPHGGRSAVIVGGGEWPFSNRRPLPPAMPEPTGLGSGSAGGRARRDRSPDGVPSSGA